jgi:pimeloyl-ACP methyl ester carboxylesterase
MKVNGHHLHVETHGPEEGLPVVLLHHGLGSVRAWKGQTLALAEVGYRVVVYDRWGYGRSDFRQGIDMPHFDCDLADLEVLLDRLGIRRAALVGHSDGGTIALYFALQCPERVSSLVTVAAHIYIEAKMVPGILGVWDVFQKDVRFREGLRRAHGEKYETVFSNWFDGWRRPKCLGWDMRPFLAKITCPALVVQGVEDEHATPRHAEELAAAIPGAALWLVEGASHMLPQEMAQGFNRRLLEFLSENQGLNLEKGDV